jgi:hypothetical protein
MPQMQLGQLRYSYRRPISAAATPRIAEAKQTHKILKILNIIIDAERSYSNNTLSRLVGTWQLSSQPLLSSLPGWSSTAPPGPSSS